MGQSRSRAGTASSSSIGGRTCARPRIQQQGGCRIPQQRCVIRFLPISILVGPSIVGKFFSRYLEFDVGRLRIVHHTLAFPISFPASAILLHLYIRGLFWVAFGVSILPYRRPNLRGGGMHDHTLPCVLTPLSGYAGATLDSAKIPSLSAPVVQRGAQRLQAIYAGEDVSFTGVVQLVSISMPPQRPVILFHVFVLLTDPGALSLTSIERR